MAVGPVVSPLAKAAAAVASKPRLFPGEERPGLYCLRMRVIRARVERHIMRNDVYGRAWLCL